MNSIDAFKFEQLRVYQESLKISDEIYNASRSFPRDEVFCLTTQVRRASVSVSLNIAEGTSRTKKDFAHFLNIAKGSCFECVAILTIAKNQGYITDEEFKKIYAKCLILTKMINALKLTLK